MSIKQPIVKVCCIIHLRKWKKAVMLQEHSVTGFLLGHFSYWYLRIFHCKNSDFYQSLLTTFTNLLSLERKQILVQLIRITMFEIYQTHLTMFGGQRVLSELIYNCILLNTLYAHLHILQQSSQFPVFLLNCSVCDHTVERSSLFQKSKNTEWP